MDYSAWQSLPAMFFEQAGKAAEKNFLWAKRDGAYRPLTWGATARAVKDLSRGLRALGLEPGERVVLVSENRPEWLIADVAVMAAGAITVPAYTTNTSADHNHLLTDSGARGAIVSTRALAERLLPAAIEAPDCKWLICIEDLDSGRQGDIEIHGWAQVLDAGAARPDHVAETVARAKRSDTACFIYTSGTGGVPKGVMLSHGAILCNCMGAYHLLEQIGLGGEVFLSFLPLSHAYEHTAGQFFPISIGAEIYYAAGIDKLPANMAEARPTIMTAVPRLYESMYQRILRGVEKQGGLKKTLFELTLRLGRKRYFEPHGLGLWERLQDRVVERLVRDKVRARFGGRLKAMVSGGAALNPDIGIFFMALGLRVLQGYGQTEAAPVVSANPPDKIKMHTVGPPCKGVEVRIADDGEILVRGELVMNGYWRNEAASAAALQGGWLHTGDIGEIDEDGYIRITDRKKDIIVLSGGDNVSPARIEGFLTLEAEIHQAMVLGDKRPHLVAILVPDEAFLARFARDRGAPPDLAAWRDDAALRAALSEALERVNEALAPLERVRRFILARAPFTVENRMMTPTLKIRRHAIEAAYGEELDGLY
ncbi:MAG: long-chain fatty acid--CoA ligase [Proteobacteria bacterium]|nr:long-chain fatty acid--CoA ligase [Pseudomonadota bacterium]